LNLQHCFDFSLLFSTTKFYPSHCKKENEFQKRLFSLQRGVLKITEMKTGLVCGPKVAFTSAFPCLISLKNTGSGQTGLMGERKWEVETVFQGRVKKKCKSYNEKKLKAFKTCRIW